MNRDPMKYVGIVVAILGIVWFISMLLRATHV